MYLKEFVLANFFQKQINIIMKKNSFVGSVGSTYKNIL